MSYLSDNSASYDRTLLSSVPDPTRAEKQEGYNVDLLDEGRDRRGQSPSNDLPTSDHQHAPTTIGYSPGMVGIKEAAPLNGEPVVAKVPWYRTRRGIIGIAVVLVLVIGGVVGGAVGGTHHSSNSHNNASTAEQGQGQGQVQASSTGPPMSATSIASSTEPPTATTRVQPVGVGPSSSSTPANPAGTQGQ